jgi:Leucine-rich repeat (LRR) protein
MKQLLLICAVVALMGGCGGKKDDPIPIGGLKSSPKAVPEKLIADPIVEKAVREELKKAVGKLTEADFEKVEQLYLDDKSLTSVEGLEKCTQLWNLDLNSNQLTELSKGLEKLTQLRWLRLDHNQLTDMKGLEKLTQLTTLRLDFNKLTDMKGLEKLTKLTYLDLRNNPALTKAQVAELQKALPNCRIYSNQ